MISGTHMLEWLMSSRVAEAARYLKPKQKVHRLEENHLILKHNTSLERFSLLRNRVTQTVCGKHASTARVGFNPSDRLFKVTMK